MAKRLSKIQVIWNGPDDGVQREAEFAVLHLGEEVAKTRAASRATVLDSFGAKPQVFYVYDDGSSEETKLSLSF